MANSTTPNRVKNNRSLWSRILGGLLTIGLIISTSFLPGGTPNSAHAEVDSEAKVTAITPTSGLVAGENTVTITGEGFTQSPRFVTVDYLQFEEKGGAWPTINTKIEMTSTTRLNLDFSIPTDLSITHVVFSSGGSSEMRLYIASLNAYWMYGSGTMNLGYKPIADTPTNTQIGNGSIIWKGNTHAYTPSGSTGSSIKIGGGASDSFSGKIFGFKIHSGANVAQFMGVPTFDAKNQEYGLLDSVTGVFLGNSNTGGTITGPPDFQPPSPPLAFYFTSTTDPAQSAACTNITVVNSTTATCVTPSSPLRPIRSGMAIVSTKPGPVNSDSVTYDYLGVKPTISTISPVEGPIKGGGSCVVTGQNFVTPVDSAVINGLVFIGNFATWTENDRSVVGLFDPNSGLMQSFPSSPDTWAVINGARYDAPPTELWFGDKKATGITVKNLTTLNCAQIPAHDAGNADLSLIVDGTPSDLKKNGYTYRAPGVLKVEKQGYLCPSGVQDPEHLSECILMETNHAIIKGEAIAWLYLTTYVEKNTNGDSVNIGAPGLTDVVVTDDKEGEVCKIPNLTVNEPYPCIARGVPGI
ncbi:MAG: IPT/TIG domain-containing protein [Propionibacteriaceae bacterium]|jgi:hypothetical protein|nr:IPT/TIG domain-containing protein [Propionibacteriaceae bacterium]